MRRSPNPPEGPPPLAKEFVGVAACSECRWRYTGSMSDASEMAWEHNTGKHDGDDVSTVEHKEAIITIYDGDLVTDHDIGREVRDLLADYPEVKVKLA